MKKHKHLLHVILKYPAVSTFQRTAPPPASAQGGNGATNPTGIGILQAAETCMDSGHSVLICWQSRENM